MSTAETVRVLLFVSVVGTVYAAAGLVAIRWAIRKWLRHGTEPVGRQILIHRLVMGLAGLGILCIAYGYYVEPYWVQVTHSRITSTRLPKGTRPLRIVHLSDLHCDPRRRVENELPDIVAAERPDLIVFSGDAINSPEGLPVLKECLSRMAKVAPMFVVRGNWDAWYWRGLDLFGGTGVQELDGTAMKLEVAGTTIWMAGVSVESEGQAQFALAQVPTGACTLFLHHYPYPDVVREADQPRVDLFCAGHIHGGQIALPWFGALVTLSKFGKQYEAGLYRAGPMWMYVSRGIGMEGGRAPRVRFCSRPEVAVIEVAPE